MQIIKEEELQQEVSLTPNGPQPKTNNQNPQVSLSNYQKALLNAFQAKPETMKLLQAIFRHYPELIVQEYAFSRPHATRKQKQSINQVRSQRLKIEKYIEEAVAKLSDIDVEQLQKLDNPKESKSDDGSSD
jgi:uncharacterized membrane protein YheB (UPF0754 family)